MKPKLAMSILVPLTLLVAACGGGASRAGTAEVASVRTISVTLAEFSIEPSQISAPLGTPLSFQVSNSGQAQHSFATDVNGKTYQTDLINPGSSATLAVPALSAGSYQAYCTVPGHRQLGMQATINVGSSSTGSTSGTTGAGSNGMPGMSSTSGSSMSAQQMAEMHKASVEAFLAGHQTSVQGNQPLKPTMDNGVKVFTLTASDVRWEVSKGNYVDAMAYNGQIPGPMIQVQPGDQIRVILQNQLDQPTVLHFHGMTVPNAMDGVPYITQDPVMPGKSFTYSFTVKNPPGLYIYHSHFNSTEQVSSGLYGAIVIEPKTHWYYHSLDVNMRTGQTKMGPLVGHVQDEYTMLLGDGPLGYTINGKSFPATTPLVAKKGDWVLIHLSNEGSLLHPMHLHGYHFEVVAQDGYPLMSPYMADTLVVAPGQTYDVLVHATYPGAWAFHCHVLPHVEGPQGMYGMVTALVVKP
jgi:manganese oxidase